MSSTRYTRDPYVVYLAYLLHGRTGDVFVEYDRTAGNMLAAVLGENHSHNRGTSGAISRPQLMVEIKAKNATPQNPPKVKAVDLFVDTDSPADKARWPDETPGLFTSPSSQRQWTLAEAEDIHRSGQDTIGLRKLVYAWPWEGSTFPEERCYLEIRDSHPEIHPSWWGILKAIIADRASEHNASLE